MKRIPLALSLAIIAGPAFGNDFDACILNHMRGVTSDFAAKQIKLGCLGEASKRLPPEVMAMLKSWNLGGYYGWTGDDSAGNAPYYRFYISLNNDTGYVISRIVVTLTTDDGKEHMVDLDRFNVPVFAAPNYVITGLPPDPASDKMLTSGQHSVVVAFPGITKADISSKNIGWDVIALYGWKQW